MRTKQLNLRKGGENKMKATKNGKRYNTNTMETIAEKDHQNYNNNYSGTTRLMRAKDGTYWLWTLANGQDLFLRDDLRECENLEYELEGMDMDEEQEKRAVELKLIEIV